LANGGGEWRSEPIRAFLAGVNDPEGRRVFGDAGAIAHILRHETFLEPEWILMAIREPDEIWVHPDKRNNKLVYLRMNEDQFGETVNVVVIVRKTKLDWEVQTAFDL
jgi:hypothetical protein